MHTHGMQASSPLEEGRTCLSSEVGALNAAWPIPVQRSSSPCSMKCSSLSMPRPLALGFANWLRLRKPSRNRGCREQKWGEE